MTSFTVGMAPTAPASGLEGAPPMANDAPGENTSFFPDVIRIPRRPIAMHWPDRQGSGVGFNGAASSHALLTRKAVGETGRDPSAMPLHHAVIPDVDAMNTFRSNRKKRAVVLLWLAEFVLLALAVVIATRVRLLDDAAGFADFMAWPWLHVLAVPALVTTSMAAFGLYEFSLRHTRTDFLKHLVLAFAFSGAALVVLYQLFTDARMGWPVPAIALAAGFVGIALLRPVLRRLFHGELFKRRIMVMGAGRNADVINQRLRRDSDRETFTLLGFLPVSGQPSVVPENLLLSPSAELPVLASELKVDEIVVALDDRRGGLCMDEMLACAQHGVVITDVSTFFEREQGVVKTELADPSWLAFSGGFDHSLARQVSKRVFDIVVASTLLLVIWPVMLLVAVAIWIESGRPILYQQTRVGENGQWFDILKFRSMRVDAEKDGQAIWCTQDDDRRTRVGEFIRTTHLDELPQLFNILRGEMSFVGPRPERPQFVATLKREVRYYDVRHCVRPGLTGLAQVRCLYGASVQDQEHRLTYDLFYVKNHSLGLDVMIMLQTVETVLFRRGSR